ncbi:hypothetical protein ACC771_18790, partial [Rhizobium ruizarguesonis]
VVEVDANGLVHSRAVGVATISIINAGGQTDIPVVVQAPSNGATAVGAAGGVVAGSGGTFVTVGPGLLSEPRTVSINAVAAANLPMAVLP